MPRPFIIWAATRTSSTNLCQALHAENEPFQAGPPASEMAWVVKDWRRNDHAINAWFNERRCFKHIPEHFDDAFNIEIARQATARGYRHIHLIRLDELGRLISNDVAGQLNAWTPDDARARFDELRRGERHINPLDVPRLIENARRIRQAWRAVEPHLSPLLTVLQERLCSWNGDTRRATLRVITRFLELPADSLDDLDTHMRNGGQQTAQIREMVPNAGELRRALVAEGLA